MADIIYGDRTGAEEYTAYVVEVRWPSRSCGQWVAAGEIRWGRYNLLAFTDRRNPGNAGKFKDDQHSFVVMNADVCVNRGVGLPRTFENMLAFTNPAEALACADRLREFGILSSPYEGQGDWRLAERGQPLAGVRVVEERLAKIVRVVEGSARG